MPLDRLIIGNDIVALSCATKRGIPIILNKVPDIFFLEEHAGHLLLEKWIHLYWEAFLRGLILTPPAISVKIRGQEINIRAPEGFNHTLRSSKIYLSSAVNVDSEHVEYIKSQKCVVYDWFHLRNTLPVKSKKILNEKEDFIKKI